jgi:hypothetical protein
VSQGLSQKRRVGKFDPDDPLKLIQVGHWNRSAAV